MKAATIWAAVALAGCGEVRQADTAAWPGTPVSTLEQHPVFLTMPVIKTKASDGMEIWNYRNGRTVSGCTGTGALIAGDSQFLTATAFQSCMTTDAACNNLFYVKDGVVQRYAPVGSGGGRCFTDRRTRPDFSGSTRY